MTPHNSSDREKDVFLPTDCKCNNCFSHGKDCVCQNCKTFYPSPKSEVSGEWSDELDKVHNDTDCCNREQVRMLVYKFLSSQRQSLEREHKEWKERVVGKVDMIEQPHPDGNLLVGFNLVIEQVKHLLLNEEIK